MNVIDRCPKCLGTRCELGTKPVTCATCSGTGMETVSSGPFIMRSTCSECKGAKEVMHHPCSECEGEGKMVLRRKVPITIPPGTKQRTENDVVEKFKKPFFQVLKMVRYYELLLVLGISLSTFELINPSTLDGICMMFIQMLMSPFVKLYWVVAPRYVGCTKMSLLK